MYLHPKWMIVHLFCAVNDLFDELMLCFWLFKSIYVKKTDLHLVEIFSYYLTRLSHSNYTESTLVEIFSYYLTHRAVYPGMVIYTSRNFFLLFNTKVHPLRQVGLNMLMFYALFCYYFTNFFYNKPIYRYLRLGLYFL